MNGATEHRDATHGENISVPKIVAPTSSNRGMVLWVLVTIVVTVLAALYMDWDFRDELFVRPRLPVKASREIVPSYEHKSK